MKKTIEEILATDDAHRETVHIKEWDAEVLIVSMTGEERADLEKMWNSGNGATSNPGGFRAAVLARSLKKEDGSPFGTPEQFKALMGKNASPIEQLFEVCCRVSKLTKQDVRELEKN